MQRVRAASVAVGEEQVSSIGPWLCAFVGVADDDEETDARRLAERVAGLRVFEDQRGWFDLSLLETGGELLVVSQFTLLADTRRKITCSPLTMKLDVAVSFAAARARAAWSTGETAGAARGGEYSTGVSTYIK